MPKDPIYFDAAVRLAVLERGIDRLLDETADFIEFSKHPAYDDIDPRYPVMTAHEHHVAHLAHAAHSHSNFDEDGNPVRSDDPRLAIPHAHLYDPSVRVGAAGALGDYSTRSARVDLAPRHATNSPRYQRHSSSPNYF